MTHGFYSKAQAVVGGTSMWSTTAGGEVEITSLGGCTWDDAVDIGPVVRWLRRGRSGLSHKAHVYVEQPTPAVAPSPAAKPSARKKKGRPG